MSSTAPAGSRYQDQRHYVVPASLDELHGPTRGIVKLDSHLDWSGDPEYDLDDVGDVLVMYQTVLNEATTVDDLRHWLNGDILRRIWSSLWLPQRLRDAWARRFRELATARSALAS